MERQRNAAMQHCRSFLFCYGNCRIESIYLSKESNRCSWCGWPMVCVLILTIVQAVPLFNVAYLSGSSLVKWEQMWNDTKISCVNIIAIVWFYKFMKIYDFAYFQLRATTIENQQRVEYKQTHTHTNLEQIESHR